MAYLLDANVFIEAKNRHYGFDFCPAFWDWLIRSNSAGTVFSVERVGQEIAVLPDQLAEWVARRGAEFFLRPTPPALTALVRVGDWAIEEDYKLPAITDFLEGAECYLVAHALADRHRVVTHEVGTRAKKRTKIPNVCASFGIECRTPFEMLRREQARFVLGAES